MFRFKVLPCIRNGEEYSAEEEHLAVQKYYYHTALIEDLVLELTRAANYVVAPVTEAALTYLAICNFLTISSVRVSAYTP